MPVGSQSVCNYAFTSTGTALNTVADVSNLLAVGLGVGGGEVYNAMKSALPEVIVVNYLDIQDSNAIPNEIFYANLSVDSGNNSGWTFTNANIVVKYLSVQDSDAIPVGDFLAYNSVDDGDNTGWVII